MDPETPVVWRIALPIPLPQFFDYLPPADQSAAPAPGSRVRVGFGQRTLVGFFVESRPAPGDNRELRPVEALLDRDGGPFDPVLWQDLVWAARYWQRPLGEVLATALPVALRQGDPAADTREALWRLTPAGREARDSLRAGARPRRLADLLAAGERNEIALADAMPDWRTPMRSLERRGLVEVQLRAPAAAAAPSPGRSGPTLNDEQAAAVEQIDALAGRFAGILLDGITGSGKTEVYLAAIERCLARGRQALVLVPEIGLTPQALQRYGDRLPTRVHSLHSGLSDGARARVHALLARGEARVVIGTRSAVFSPLPEAGLIIVDEEHDASYKQQDGFRYHARDFALVRGRSQGIPVVLGSATPSLESLRHAREDRFTWLRLRQRPTGARPPRVHVLDLRGLRLRHGLSQGLVDALRLCLERGEQALVFRNRRGYAPVLMCHDCGWHAECPRCDRALTLHGRRRLVCHHCGHQRTATSACPDCGSLGLNPHGVGTERLEEALAGLFPGVPLVRVDRETTRHRDALARHFEALGDAPGLLVGTQMLAKGHDLPKLTLVAIVNVDEGLFSVDFRAPERLAQLLVQVSGRAGRAERPGEVWLQTHHPEHPLLQTLVSRGYPAFAEAELAERAAAGLPPYAHLALLRAEAPRREPLDAFLAAAHALADGHDPRVYAHPPVDAPMPRRAGRLRAQVLLESRHRPSLQAALRHLQPAWYALPEARRVRWSLDVDPVDLY